MKNKWRHLQHLRCRIVLTIKLTSQGIIWPIQVIKPDLIGMVSRMVSNGRLATRLLMVLFQDNLRQSGKRKGDALVATDKMKKSDGNTDFTITIRIFKYKAKKNHLITITMSDGNPNHEMAFANQKNFFESSKESKKESPNQQDLDIVAIMKGDYRTLAGYWKNEEGREITISADGKTNRNENISPNLISTSKFPTLNIRWGNTGALIALFKIGFKNPYGDKSDTSRPRLLLGQNIGNEPADQYYYRQ